VRAHSSHVAKRASVLGAAAIALLSTVLPFVAATLAVSVAPASAEPGGSISLASADAPSTNSMTVESQSPAFVTAQSGVHLAIEISSALPPGRLALEVTLWSQVTYRSTMRQTLSSNFQGLSPLDSEQIPLTNNSLDWSSGAVVPVQLPIIAPDLPGTPGKGTNGVTLSIDTCIGTSAASPGTCAGVYPLQVSLLDLQLGVTYTSFTTDVILTPPSETVGTHPLRFAWVMPLGSSGAIAPSGQPVKDPTDIAEINDLASILDQAPNASITLNVFPQFVEALTELNDPDDQAALVSLRTLNRGASQVAVVPGTFVPTDVDALTSDLPGSLGAQLSRARTILSPLISFEAHEYVATAPISSQSLSDLAQSGVTRLLVPSNGAQPLSARFAPYTPTAPFNIPNSGVSAIASDPGLEQDIANKVSPALRAEQMLADLSVIYFANPEPNQAVAVESPLGQPLDMAFISDMLKGLSESSVVHAVTLPDVFDTVAVGSSSYSPNPRGLAKAVPVPSGNQLPVATIHVAQRDLAALNSMLPDETHKAGRPPLADLILTSEGIALSSSERQAYLAPIDKKADGLASYVTLPLGRTITVTSLDAKIPISIVSTAPVPVTVELTASSSFGLRFPKGHTWTIKLYPRTNVVQIQLTAGTSGDFPLHLSLTSRSGFVIQSGYMTIRSTAISGVAVALSVGAAVFLVVWWMRAIVTKRRKQHKLRGAALAASVMPGNDGGD